MKSKRTVLIACALGTLLLACDKKEQAGPTGPQGPTAPVQLTFKFYDGATPTQFAYMQDNFGNTYVFDEVRMLLSNFRLIDDGGVTIAQFPGKVIAVDPDIAGFNISAIIGYAPYGHIAHLAFDIGLGPALNSGTPAGNITAPLNDSTYWWGPSLGYKFFQAKGYYDSDDNHYINPGDASFYFYCAGPSSLRSVDLPVTVDHGGSGSSIALKIQMAGLIGNNPAYALDQMSQSVFMDRLQAAISLQ